MEHFPRIILVNFRRATTTITPTLRVSHSPLSSCSSHDSTHSIGYGDICPGNAGTLGKLFVMTLAGAGMGFFCGPLLQLGGAWRHAIPGGLPALASFVIGMGIVIFVSVEGLDHLDAVYANIVTGKCAASGLGWNVAVYVYMWHPQLLLVHGPTNYYLTNTQTLHNIHLLDTTQERHWGLAT